MAIITNRSPWLVSVARRPELTSEFPFKQLPQAQAYLASLEASGHNPKLEQLANAFQVRARDKGFPVFCASFTTREEAEKTLKQLEANRALSIFRDFAAATKVTLAELMQRYIEEVAHRHKGGGIEAGRLRKLIRTEDFVDKPLASLSTEDLQDFVYARLEEVEPATVDREVDVISQVLNYSAKVWKIAPSENPLEGLQRPRYFNERSRRLRGDEEERLLAAARADENPYVEPLIILALATAMRRGELLGLQWENIDFARRSAFLPETKNGRSRSVPLPMQAVVVLQALPRSGDFVFPISANALKKAFFNRVIPASGVEDFRFHDLRHEATSRLAESGKFSLIDLQAVTGHRDVRMLMRYSHLCTQKLAEKADEVLGTVKEYTHRGRKRRVMVPIEVMPGVPATKSASKKERRSSSVEPMTKVDNPSEQVEALPANVVMFPGKRAVA